MAYTFGNFKDYLKVQMGNAGDFESVGGTNLYGVWINAARRRLSTQNRFWDFKRNFKFPSLYDSASDATVDGTAYIDVPTGALYVEYIYDETNDVALSYIKNKQYFSYTDRSDTDNEGEPKEYTRRGSYIYLHPTPDDAYTLSVYYRAFLQDLAADSAVSGLGEEWDDVILQLAAYIGFMWINDYDNATQRQGEVLWMLKNRIGIYDNEEKGIRGRNLQASAKMSDYGFEG